MRVPVSILVAFVVGVLPLVAGVEWALETLAGPCGETGCPAWRAVATYALTVPGWLLLAWGFHSLWERLRPEAAPTPEEEYMLHLRRGRR